MTARPELELRVVAAHLQGEGVTSYELADLDGAELPVWAPGAHVDVHLPSGVVRQYSLCGDAADRARYRIAVLELPSGRGGSVEVHSEFRPGAIVGVSAPRAAFALVPAERYVFVAGGIGITPILPMVRALQRDGVPWELVYCARSAAHFSFADELRSVGGTVRLIAEDVDGRPDLHAVVEAAEGAAVFCCGPTGLMDALTAAMSAVGRTDLHLERFTAARPEVGDGGGFEVELIRSGVVVDVPEHLSVLDAVRAAGIDAPSSCEMGIGGTCETKVIRGDVDHRDELLTAEERHQNNTMMICVSRAACPRLVLDL